MNALAQPLTQDDEAASMAASLLYLMSEYAAEDNPLLAALVAGELAALGRLVDPRSPLAYMVQRMNRRWRALAQSRSAEALQRASAPLLA